MPLRPSRAGAKTNPSPGKGSFRRVLRKALRSPMRKGERFRALYLSLALLLPALTLSCAGGCGSRPSSAVKSLPEEVRSALTELSSSSSFSFNLRLETWVGVSGYAVYGEERGEGVLEGEDFTLEMQRISPEGEDRFTLSYREGGYYLRRDGLERPAEGSEVPGLLFRPREFLALFSKYKGVHEEGEEERDGERCRVFRLDYNPSLAAEVLPSQAKEYFTNLDYELNGRLWLSDLSPYPVALSLELTGQDRAERLRRLRMTYTFQPSAEGRP